MSKWLAALPLISFFLALLAYWCWQRAKEAAVDADLQQRLCQHSKYQREFGDQTPLEMSRQMSRQQSLFRALAVTLGLCAVGCLAALLLKADLH